MPTRPPSNLTCLDFEPLPWASAVTTEPLASRHPEFQEAPLPLPVFPPFLVLLLFRLRSPLSKVRSTI